jgi:hypothetical protein
MSAEGIFRVASLFGGGAEIQRVIVRCAQNETTNTDTIYKAKRHFFVPVLLSHIRAHTFLT